MDNYSTKAAFTVDVATLDLWGMAMITTNTFADTAGTLIAATKFSAIRNLLSGDVFNVGYRFTMSST